MTDRVSNNRSDHNGNLSNEAEVNGGDSSSPAESASGALGRLLPESAYPSELTEEGRDFVDARLRRDAHLIPTAPGLYVDREGDLWTLTDEGLWVDRTGKAGPREHTSILALFGIRPLGDQGREALASVLEPRPSE